MSDYAFRLYEALATAKANGDWDRADLLQLYIDELPANDKQ